MDVKKILKEATDNGASDIFIVAGRPLTYKSKGVMECLNEIRMIPKETFEFVTSIYALAERDISKFEETGDDDFSFAIPGVSRYRVSTFKQRGSYSAVIRVISFTLPKPSDLHIPDSVMELAETNNGMVLVTGPAGSGKSTTLACIIDQINHEKEEHIITLEDPLEFYIVMTNVLCHSVKSTQIQKAISLHFAPHSARVLTSYCLERCETMRPSIQLSQRLKPVTSYFHHFTQLVPQIPLTE